MRSLLCIPLQDPQRASTSLEPSAWPPNSPSLGRPSGASRPGLHSKASRRAQEASTSKDPQAGFRDSRPFWAFSRASGLFWASSQPFLGFWLRFLGRNLFWAFSTVSRHFEPCCGPFASLFWASGYLFGASEERGPQKAQQARPWKSPNLGSRVSGLSKDFLLFWAFLHSGKHQNGNPETPKSELQGLGPP